MTLAVRFRIEAVDELDEVAGWYQERSDGLGLAFLSALDRVVDSLARWPRTGAVVDDVPGEMEVRRVPIDRFPYSVAYLVLDDVLVVLAVSHERQEPRYWIGRAAR